MCVRVLAVLWVSAVVAAAAARDDLTAGRQQAGRSVTASLVTVREDRGVIGYRESAVDLDGWGGVGGPTNTPPR